AVLPRTLCDRITAPRQLLARRPPGTAAGKCCRDRRGPRGPCADGSPNRADVTRGSSFRSLSFRSPRLDQAHERAAHVYDSAFSMPRAGMMRCRGKSARTGATYNSPGREENRSCSRKSIFAGQIRLIRGLDDEARDSQASADAITSLLVRL